MRLRPLLLHALLSLALVANGMGGAMASVHAACAHDTVAAAAPAAAAAAPAAEPPCHEDMGANTSNAHSGMFDDGMHESSPSQHASTPDEESCGDCANHCQCACIAHGLAALLPPTLLIAASTGIRYASATSYAYRAPTLQHPVRPPIG